MKQGFYFLIHSKKQSFSRKNQKKYVYAHFLDFTDGKFNNFCARETIEVQIKFQFNF